MCAALIERYCLMLSVARDGEGAAAHQELGSV